MIYVNDEPVIHLDPNDDPSISKDIEEDDASVTVESSAAETPLC